MAKRNLTRLIVVGLMLLALPACAGTYDRYFGFEFGMLDPNKDVEILNYRYGDSKIPFTRPAAYQLAAGHINQATSVGAIFPPGDVLYVKWRVISTGKVYEDTVDLSSSLPSNMFDKTIHFSVQGSQLYVYLIEDNDRHDPDAPACPAKLYAPNECARIYPDHWKNYSETTGAQYGQE